MPFHKKQDGYEGTPSPEGAVRVRLFYFLPIFFLAVIPFVRVLDHGFINLDDPVFIENNELVTGLIVEQLNTIFSQGWGTPYYKPLVYLSWNIDDKLGGGAAWMFYLHNLLLHSLNSLLVFWLVLFIARRLKFRHALMVSLFAALIFAWHPMKVESVAWAMQRKDLLFSFFYLLTLIFYLQYRQSERNWYAMASGFTFLLALLSKSMAISLPVVALLLYLLLFQWNTRRLIKSFIPIGIALLFGLFAYGVFENFSEYIQGRSGAEVVGEVSSGSGIPEEDELSISNTERIFASGHRLSLWVFHFFWPEGLSVVYPLPDSFKEGGIPLFHMFSTAFFLILGLIFTGMAIKGTPKPLLIYLMFMLMITPALLQRGHDTTYVSDRFLYLPSLLLILPLLVLLAGILRKQIFIPVLVVLSLALALLSWKQTSHWQSSETLWKHSLAHYEAVPTAWNNLGMVYFERGNSDEAGQCFKQAILHNSFDPELYNNYGSILAQNGHFEEAISHFSLAVKLDEEYASAWSNLGLARLDANFPQQAVDAFNMAVKLEPDNRTFRLDLAKSLHAAGKSVKAIEVYSRLIQESPRLYNAWVGRGMASIELGNTVSAIQDFTKAIELNPQFILAYVNRGVVYAREGNFDQAIPDFNEALSLDNTMTDVWYMLAVAYQNLGKNEDACQAYRQAAKLGHPGAAARLKQTCENE